jgi:hypothetical protein
MKISYAAAFSGTIFLIAILFTAFIMRPGLRTTGVLLPRQAWVLESQLMWSVGWWLWLLAIFSWMLLLITFMWRYTPAHRVPTMLQSGLMLIAAVLAIAGVVIWMGALPVAADQIESTGAMLLVDTLAMGLLGAATFMGGLVTAWIGIDLARLKKLTWLWLTPGILAGLFAAPSPFLFPNVYHLLISGALWLIWCLFLATRRNEPKAFAEWL